MWHHLSPEIEIAGRKYRRDQYGVLHQTDAKPFLYTTAYTVKQQTTPAMAHLRLGFLASHLSVPAIQAGGHLELGPGNGQFMLAMRAKGIGIEGFDVAEGSAFSTVTDAEARQRQWNCLFLFDVLEHFEDIDDLWRYRWDFACISVPCCPPDIFLPAWRHLKSEEHLHHFTPDSFRLWAQAHGAKILAHANVEDLIRTRWNPSYPNIMTFILQHQDLHVF